MMVVVGEYKNKVLVTQLCHGHVSPSPLHPYQNLVLSHQMNTIDCPQILFIDCYDSFTNNLAALFLKAIPKCRIRIIKNDDYTIAQLLPYLDSFSAIIVGPGPGSPTDPCDIGVVKDLWMIDQDHLLPIFGVCLGLQSMAVEYGAKLQRLSVVKHGLISLIQHEGSELFKGLSHFNATRYHSLHVQVPINGEIEELAWADDGSENGKVTMALKHKSKPFWAVQYHPESVCTTGGLHVVSNFWRLAQNWHRAHGPKILSSVGSIGTPWPNIRPRLEQNVLLPCSSTVQMKKLFLSDIEIPRIAEILGATDEASPFVMLDSAAAPGRWSIIGSILPSTVRIVYFTGDNFLTLIRNDKRSKHFFPRGVSAWSWITSFMSSKRAQGGNPEVPFWGGLIGYLSYECGLESLSVSPSSSRRGHPDINLIFIERSVVIDLQQKQVYVQSILTHDESWIAETCARLTSLPARNTHTLETRPLGVDVKIPHKTEYTTKISRAKEYLMSGDSYELCLTAQTRISVPRSYPNDPFQTPERRSWNLYKKLRHKNPAPHAAYLRLGETTVLSASPERFLSFSRAPRPVCQLRPIKGTLRKGPGITRAVAEEALAGNPKEVAENLMIVDLIRHDLHGVLGEDVKVRQFCRVEEYKTVWQLVSVIEGSPAVNISPNDNWKVGWEVLQHSLPPGSMTGAPKKRSVEILKTLEDGARGIYSGVLGYWCVSGSGDWAVVIRSCVNQPTGSTLESEYTNSTGPDSNVDVWTIGAGGAITALSDPEAEYDEMCVKLQSALAAF